MPIGETGENADDYWLLTFFIFYYFFNLIFFFFFRDFPRDDKYFPARSFPNCPLFPAVPPAWKAVVEGTPALVVGEIMR